MTGEIKHALSQSEMLEDGGLYLARGLKGLQRFDCKIRGNNRPTTTPSGTCPKSPA